MTQGAAHCGESPSINKVLNKKDRTKTTLPLHFGNTDRRVPSPNILLSELLLIFFN